jgi:hypothetical protein
MREVQNEELRRVEFRQSVDKWVGGVQPEVLSQHPNEVGLLMVFYTNPHPTEEQMMILFKCDSNEIERNLEIAAASIRSLTGGEINLNIKSATAEKTIIIKEKVFSIYD